MVYKGSVTLLILDNLRGNELWLKNLHILTIVTVSQILFISIKYSLMGAKN